MEGKDKRSFAGEMSEEDDFGTFPDLSVADGFVLLVRSNSDAMVIRTYGL